jgi:peroxiredoxin
MVWRDKMNKTLIAIVVAAFSIGTRLQSAELGMKAPPLEVSQWIKGGPITLAQPPHNNIYVLLFWETGCQHCLTILPELTMLDARFRDQGLIVVGISTEPPGVIKDFINLHRDISSFNFASDTERTTYRAYMTAFGQATVPYAFIIGKEGTILWQRHPMAGLTKAVEQIMGGVFDFGAEKRAAFAEKMGQEYIAKLKKDNKSVLSETLNKQILTEGVVNPWMLNNFACDILDVPVTNGPALDLAIQVAKTAYESRGGIDSAFADTYAHTLAVAGKFDEAIKMQKRAIDLCSDKKFLPFLQKTLEGFQTNQTSFSK